MRAKLGVMIVLAAAAMSSIAPTWAQELTAEQKVEQYDLAQANKELVTTAYQQLFGDHDVTAVDRYWSDDYIQHNPYVGDGKQALLDMLNKFGILASPKSTLEFLRVSAEGDLVWVQMAQPTPDNGPALVIVDIFRVEDGKIAEHWDVMQQVPADATNPRPMY